MRSSRPAHLSPGGARAVGGERPPDERALSGEQLLRVQHRVSLSPAALTLADTSIVWGSLQLTEAWEMGVCRSSPGDSEVQSGLRSTGLR